MTVRGFNEDIYKQTATQKYRLGHMLETPDGSRFRYVKTGASNIAAGVLCQGPLPIDDHHEIIVTTVPAVGDLTIKATLGGSTVATKDQYKDGYVVCNKGTGLGITYRVKGNNAAGAGGVITITLYADSPILVAGAAGDEFGLYSPYNGMLIHASPATAGLVGVTRRAMTAGYYGWVQTKGRCGVLTSGTVVIGNAVSASDATDGAVMPVIDFSLRVAVGTCEMIGVAGEDALINLNLPG